MGVKYNMGDTYTIQKTNEKISIDTLTTIIGYTTIVVFFIMVWEFIFVKGPLANHKRYMLRNYLSSVSWIILFTIILIIWLAIHFIPVKTDDLKSIKKMANLKEAIVIGTVLFLTAFLTNLGYTVGLFFVSAAIWYVFKINILSPVSATQGYTGDM